MSQIMELITIIDSKTYLEEAFAVDHDNYKPLVNGRDYELRCRVNAGEIKHYSLIITFLNGDHIYKLFTEQERNQNNG